MLDKSVYRWGAQNVGHRQFFTFGNCLCKLWLVAHPFYPSTWETGKEDYEFHASLSYTIRSCLKGKTISNVTNLERVVKGKSRLRVKPVKL